MTKQERIFFNQLHKKRVQQSLVLQDDDLIGIWTSIVDKYPESAHFVYEMLQNADDAEATSVNILLKKDGLIFKHNGRIHFNISDPNNKEEKKGHINSITAVANSTKKADGNTIGKFGVGFKAVFQYTECPEIYDDDFKFRIENYIIPIELSNDHPFRSKGETLFYFPFKDREISYSEVKHRLTSLDNPILFLRHLETVHWSEDGSDSVHSYSKIVEKDYSTLSTSNISCKYLNIQNAERIDKLLMFEKPVTLGYIEYPVYLGYYLGASGKLDLNISSRVFCYFPTKESFPDCHFICHAPFLLTDSRQNIKNNKDNDFLKENLAWLAAQSLPILRDIGLKGKNKLVDENLFKLVSMVKNHYIDFELHDDIFYNKQVSVLNKEPLVLCKDGIYRQFKDCYACIPMSLYNLLGSDQIKIISNSNDNASLVSEKIQQLLVNNIHEIYSNYCTNLGLHKLTVESLASSITPQFMSAQSSAWVLRLYRFLYEEVKYSWQKGSFRTAPFIKTTKGEWVAPYQSDNTLNVFLPLDVDTEDYNIVDKEYLTNDIVKRFFHDLGIKEPSREDYIKTKILPKYKEEDIELSCNDIKKDFEIIVSYYCSLEENQKSSFIETIKANSYKLFDGKNMCDPNKIYFLFDENLKEFVKYDKSLHFLDFGVYFDSINSIGINVCISFFISLGINLHPVIWRNNLYYSYRGNDAIQKIKERLRKNGKSTGYTFVGIEDWRMDGLDSYFNNVKVIPFEISKIIWNVLSTYSISQISTLKYYYRVYRGKTDYYSEDDSSIITLLKEKEWLFGKRPDQVCIEELESSGFEINEKLCQIFGIYHKNTELKNAGLSDDEIEILNVYKDLKKEGVSKEKIKQILCDQKKTEEDNDSLEHESVSIEKPADESVDNPSQGKGNSKDTKKDSQKDRKEETLDLIEEHMNYADTWKQEFDSLKNLPNLKPKSAGASSFGYDSHEDEIEQNDNSVFGSNISDKSAKTGKNNHISENINVNKNITEAQNEIVKALNEQDLIKRLDLTAQYTFEWFCLLLGLQKLKLPKEKKVKDLCINFYDYDISEDEGMLTLKNPTSLIPLWVEESSCINIGIFTPKETSIDAKIVSVEAEKGLMYFDVREQDGIKDILSKSKKFVVVCQSQSNIFDSLIKRFAQLDYKHEDNLKDLLPDHISFIYGPPGTGKTSELIKQISEKVKIAEKYDTKMSILVLTPTNKAADVIADKILQDEHNTTLSQDLIIASRTCSPYLRRYGISNSDACKYDYDCVYNRDTLEMDNDNINIVVTTIARYAYDYIISDGNTVDMCDFKWNYIIFDESSMIDLIPFMYVLHKAKSNDTCFIVAGDPKQIPAVNTIGYDYGNIYSCIGIKDLQYAINTFKRYPLMALTTQYRSVPDIGEFISHFCYNGILKTYRSRDDEKTIKVEKFNFKHINFLGFEIKDFNLLYSRNAIGQSSINLYSVLFTYEFVKYVVEQLNKNNPDDVFTIGIVSPYRAEADAIRQMFENYPISIHVSCGTIHSFQGDECDIMFLVLNPALSNSSETHVNKEYILNVALSRAKDYLFIIAPSGNDALPILKHIKRDLLDKYSISYTEEQCSKVEQKIFGQSNWIECNTGISGHSNINAYNDIQRTYDIRLSDVAMDIRKSKSLYK